MNKYDTLKVVFINSITEVNKILKKTHKVGEHQPSRTG